MKLTQTITKEEEVLPDSVQTLLDHLEEIRDHISQANYQVGEIDMHLENCEEDLSEEQYAHLYNIVSGLEHDIHLDSSEAAVATVIEQLTED